MAIYTQSLREILEQNKRPEEEITNARDIISIANRCIFNETDGVERIPVAYRDWFEGGFLLHFFNDEICYETLPLWLLALNEKFYNYGDYITAIYENLDKQVFANYKVRHAKGTKKDTGEKTLDININDVLEETRVGSDERASKTSDKTETNKDSSTSDTGAVEKAHTGQEEKTSTGTIDRSKDGTDTLQKTGMVQDSKSGSDTLVKTGNVTTEKTGSDKLERRGNDKASHTGTQTTEESINSTVNNTGTTTDKNNAIAITSDTPQGSLQNLRTPGGDATGTGVSYVQGQSYNYMSAASESDATNVNEVNTENVTDTTDDTQVTFNDTNTTTHNTTDTTIHDTNDRETRNLADVTNYGQRNTTTNNLTDRTIYDTNESEKSDTNDTTSFNTKETETRDTLNKVDEKIDSDRQIDVTDTKATSDTTNRTDNIERGENETSTLENEHEDEIIDYEINWEMLYKSTSLLDRVWKIFDDLFMIIF